MYEGYSTFVHSSGIVARVLKPDGRFESLFRVGTRTVSAAPIYSLGDAPDGEWTYEVIDGTQARLVLQVPGHREETILTFETDTSGSTTRTLAPSGSFELVPLAVAAPLSNSSNRSFVRPGGRAFAGFVLTEPRFVLMRGVGPGLASLGVGTPLQRPLLTLRRADGSIVASDDPAARSSGATALARTSALVGAFPMTPGDAAVVVWLDRGAYVADVVSADPTGEGEVLIEVYLLP